MDTFNVAPGFFLMRPVSLKGRPQGAPDRHEAYRHLRALRAVAFYVVEKKCVSTPLGYFATPEAMEELETLLAEVKGAAEIPNLLGSPSGTDPKGFSLTVGGYGAPIDPTSAQVRVAMCAFLFRRLSELRSRLVSGRKAYVYTQDDMARLWTVCGDPDFADTVRRAVEAAKTEGSTILLDDILRRLNGEECTDGLSNDHGPAQPSRARPQAVAAGRKRHRTSH